MSSSVLLPSALANINKTKTSFSPAADIMKSGGAQVIGLEHNLHEERDNLKKMAICDVLVVSPSNNGYVFYYIYIWLFDDCICLINE